MLTITGLLPIEEVQAGDLVLSLDQETGAWSYERVVETFVTPDQEILELNLEDANGAQDTLRTTSEHPFWTAERGWTPASALGPGDRVFQAPEGWLAVSSAVWTRDRETVYNFEVENTHTYFVGSLGAWVHNACTPLRLRLSQIHNALDPIARAKRTTAILQTSGPRVIAAGTRDLAKVQRALLGPGEVAAKLPGAHAEATALHHATQNGLTARQLVTSWDICPACRALIDAHGGVVTGPRSAVWPR